MCKLVEDVVVVLGRESEADEAPGRRRHQQPAERRVDGRVGNVEKPFGLGPGRQVFQKLRLHAGHAHVSLNFLIPSWTFLRAAASEQPSRRPMSAYPRSSTNRWRTAACCFGGSPSTSFHSAGSPSRVSGASTGISGTVSLGSGRRPRAR